MRIRRQKEGEMALARDGQRLACGLAALRSFFLLVALLAMCMVIDKRANLAIIAMTPTK